MPIKTFEKSKSLFKIFAINVETNSEECLGITILDFTNNPEFSSEIIILNLKI